MASRSGPRPTTHSSTVPRPISSRCSRSSHSASCSIWLGATCYWPRRPNAPEASKVIGEQAHPPALCAGWQATLQKLELTRRSANVRDMGDKSPKTKNKQAAQKQAKANTAAKQKNDNKAAKQTVKPKR